MLETRNIYEIYNDLMNEFQTNYQHYNEQISEDLVRNYLNNVFARAYQSGDCDILYMAERILDDDWENIYCDGTDEEKFVYAKAKYSFSEMTGKVFNYL